MEGCRHVGVDVNMSMFDLETSTEDSEDEHDFPPGSVNRRCDELMSQSLDERRDVMSQSLAVGLD